MAGFSLRTLFGRRKVEIRNENIVTGLSFDDLMKLFNLEDIGATITASNALDAIPVQACCALIAGGIISMPLRIVRRELVNGAMTQAPADNHEFWWLFNEQPCRDYSAAYFWEQILKRKLLWGRSFARIIRKAGGRSIAVDELVFVPNEKVQIEYLWDPVARVNRISRYLVRDGAYTYGVLPEDMLDFRGQASGGDNQHWNATGSLQAGTYPTISDIIRSSRDAIGIVLTIEQYCAKFFGNGGMPRTVLQYPQGAVLTDAQINQIRDSWVKRYGGSDNAGMPLVLANGGTANKLTFTAEEAQMLEARRFQVIEIARAFGVPPFMIGETDKTSAWGTGIEQMSQGFIRYTLGPHVTAIEQEINRKLFRIDRYFVDFDEEALARGDMKALGEWFRQAVGGSMGPGFMTINEVRSRMKLPPVADGDGIYDPKGVSDAQPTDGAAGG